jgi:hypothetical protein
MHLHGSSGGEMVKACSIRCKTKFISLLWTRLRNKQLKGYQFYIQKIVGNYIVDFCCPRANLVVEVDGSQHYEDKSKEKAKARDDCLENSFPNPPNPPLPKGDLVSWFPSSSILFNFSLLGRGHSRFSKAARM